jgi:hypothetical protein
MIDITPPLLPLPITPSQEGLYLLPLLSSLPYTILACRGEAKNKEGRGRETSSGRYYGIG